MTPDEFNDSARTWVLLMLRDNPQLGSAIPFKEGYEFANSIAIKMTEIYRSAIKQQ